MSASGQTPTSPPRCRRLLRVSTGILIASIVAFYGWSLHLPAFPSLRETQTDYYALQVHGWRKGSLAMDATPHPDLRVEYPNRITQLAPALLDASYYQGRYYLYFGPVPALVLLLPYHLLTGWDIPLPLAVLFFATAGFLLSLGWFRLLLREFFPTAPSGVQLAGVAVLGLANMAPFALVRPLFYEVAASAGYAFTQAALWAGTLACLRPAASHRGLAAASLLAGLAAGCRPNLIVGPAFFLPLAVAALWWSGPRTRRHALSLLASAGIPAALCAAALLAHNHARFGDFFEFGLNLQLGANPSGFGFSWDHVWHNLRLYYFNPPLLDWYFPFVGAGAEGFRPAGYYGVEEMQGQFLLVPAALIAAGIALARPAAASFRLGIIAAGVALAGGVNVLLVSASGVRANRYMLDFQPVFLVAVLLAVLAGATDPRRGVRWLARVGTAVLLLLCVYNVFISFQADGALRLRNASVHAAIETRLNRVAAPLQRLFGAQPGAQLWRVTFPAGIPGRIEPLVVAGFAPAYDALLVEYLAPDRARLLFQHYPHGFIPGPAFDFQPGRPVELVLHIGTLFPPGGHPWYGSLPLAAQLRLRHALEVRLDGASIMSTGAACHAASLNAAGVGRRWLSNQGRVSFGGLIEPLGTIPLAPPAALADRLEETVEVLFPTNMTERREPLAVYGPNHAGPGDSVFIEYVDSSSIRFGADSDGIVTLSPVVPVDYAQPHSLSLLYRASAPDGSRPGLVRIRLDGATVWSARLTSRRAPDAVALALANPWLYPAQRTLFTGTVLHRQPAVTGEPPVDTWPSTTPPTEAEGPLEMRLEFPLDRTGAREPLLVAGISGNAFGLYARYVAHDQVVFGVDHWGVFAAESPPITLDYETEHVIWIDGDFLHRNPAKRPGRLELRVDGRVVWTIPLAGFRNALTPFVIGENPIGMSTAETRFTGVIHWVRGAP